MNPSKYFVSLVNEVTTPGIGYDEKWRLAEQKHPDAATLMRAFGQTRQNIEFANSQWFSKAATPGKARAREEFQEKVKGRMEAMKCGYDEAFSWANRHHTTLANEMQGGPATFANAAMGPQVTKLFRMPTDSSTEEKDAAWKGNGETATPFNPGKIFAALCALAMRTKYPQEQAALTFAKGRYPELWAAVEEISKAKI